MVVNWYLCRTHNIKVQEKKIVEQITDRAGKKVSNVLSEKVINRLTIHPHDINLGFLKWSAAYSNDKKLALVRVEDGTLPQGLFLRKLETQKDFEAVYKNNPELKNKFTDQPF